MEYRAKNARSIHAPAARAENTPHWRGARLESVFAERQRGPSLFRFGAG